MRTSYEPKPKEIEEVQDPVDIYDMRKGIINTYYEISDQVEYLRQQELSGYEEALNREADKVAPPQVPTKRKQVVEEEDEEDEDEDKEDEEDDEEARRKHKKKLAIIWSSVSTGVVVLAIVCFFVIRSFVGQDNSLEGIQTRISKLYTSEKKEDIKQGITQKDLDEFYISLTELAGKDENTKEAEIELDTIGYFLSDKGILEGYDSDTYDLTTVGMQDSIAKVRTNTENYTVPGLAVTINNLATKILQDYDSFIAIRSELQGITDVLNFNDAKYKDTISRVVHKPNKQELDTIYAKLQADKIKAKAEEELKNAASEEAKEQAQKALEEAQKLQEKTQQELENTKKKLEEEAEKMKKQLEEKTKKDTTVTPTPEEKKPAEPEEPQTRVAPESDSPEVTDDENSLTTEG